MKHKFLVFLFSLVLTLSLGSFERVLACSCVANVLPCQRFGFSDAIFVGKAIGVKKEKGKETSQEIESTIFVVEEAIAGVKSKQIVVNNKTGSSCDVSFAQGETYLVFANGNAKKGYSTGYCSGNLPIDEAGEDLLALRNLPTTGAGGRLYGNVSESLKKRDVEYAVMPGVNIKIREIGGRRKIYNAVTDGEGNYELIVPQGKYKITPTIPTYAETGIFSEDSIFVKDRGCAEKSFVVENKSQINGKVVDSQNKPVAEIRVELVSVDGEKPEPFSDNGGSTEATGEFSIENVPSGRYTLSVNYLTTPDEESPFPTVFYPNSSERKNAAIIEVGLGQRIDNLILRLPPRIATQKIYGTVIFPDGRPAVDITVNLQREDSDISFSYTRADKDGNFVLNGFTGEKYNFGVQYYGDSNEKRNYTIKKSVFTLDKNTQPFRLILEEMSEEDKNR